jgi:folylpolyglutamate synthase/dihydropteroate synthase
MGVSEDKDIEAISAHLKDAAAYVFLTQAKHPRAHVFTRSDVESYFSGKPVEIVESLSKALPKALEMAEAKDVVLVTGSVFVVAEAIDWVVHR